MVSKTAATKTLKPNDRKKPIMNTTRLITAIALTFAASGAALAQEATYEYPQAAVSQVSRSAVQADLNLARAEGKLLVSEASVGGQSLFVSQLSRGMVRAEAVTALKTGHANDLTAEPYAFTVNAMPSLPVLTLASK